MLVRVSCQLLEFTEVCIGDYRSSGNHNLDCTFSCGPHQQSLPVRFNRQCLNASWTCIMQMHDEHVQRARWAETMRQAKNWVWSCTWWLVFPFCTAHVGTISLIHGEEPDDFLARCITCEECDCKMTHPSFYSSHGRPCVHLFCAYPLGSKCASGVQRVVSGCTHVQGFAILALALT